MPKLATPLTNIQPRTAKPKPKPYKLTDGGGLYLLVNTDGARYWGMDYRFGDAISVGTYALASSASGCQPPNLIERKRTQPASCCVQSSVSGQHQTSYPKRQIDTAVPEAPLCGQRGNQSMPKERHYMRLWHFVLGIVLAIVFPFGFYLSFHSLTWAETQPDWGNFGSYMSGVAGPAVGAVTLVFMILSFRQQARAASTTIFFAMVAEHEKSIRAYSTEYSQGYTGLAYLQWIWGNVANKAQHSLADDEGIGAALRVNTAELIPFISAVVSIVRYADEDPNFDRRTKERYAQYFWSRLSGVEKKLLLAIIRYDSIGQDLKPLFVKYRDVVRTQVSTSELEIPFIDKLRDYVLS